MTAVVIRLAERRSLPIVTDRDREVSRRAAADYLKTSRARRTRRSFAAAAVVTLIVAAAAGIALLWAVQ